MPTIPGIQSFGDKKPKADDIAAALLAAADVEDLRASGKMACRVCRLRLNPYRGTFGSSGKQEFRWIHARFVDHEPDPVPIDELDGQVRLVCDFCSDYDPEWLLECPDYVATAVFTDGSTWSAGSGGGAWTACQDCVDAIERGDWSYINDRATDYNVERLTAELAYEGKPALTRDERRQWRRKIAKDISQQHAAFRKNATGKRYQFPYIETEAGRIIIVPDAEDLPWSASAAVNAMPPRRERRRQSRR